MITAALGCLRRLAADRSGISAVEFGLSLPLLVTMAMYGLELVNVAHAHQRIGDIATLTADNISRIRVGIGEGDVTETLNGLKASGANLSLGARGRIIVSSVRPVLNTTTTPATVTDQQIRWQRCTGALNVASSYGAETALLGTAGMGPAGRRVAATENMEIIFVEVVYSYPPLISSALLGGDRTIRSIASMAVRDRVSNDMQALGTASPCNQFTA